MGKNKKSKKSNNVKPINCTKKSVNTLIKICIELIIIVFGAVISFDVYKWMHPYYTMIESDYITNGFGQVNGGTEIYPVLLNGNMQTCITLRNDNNRSIHIKQIVVNVYEYEEVKEYKDKSEKNGIGGLETPICLKAEIGSEKGKYSVEIDPKYSEVEYIALEAGEIDIFLLALVVDKEGLYDIDVEFSYIYGKKMYCAKTDRQKIICVDR